MQYIISARRTMFAGILFDSILEATWAAFFTILRIEWIYHPQPPLFDWPPDFLILMNGIHIYVEVKPFKTLQDFIDIRHQACNLMYTNLVLPANASIGLFGETPRYTTCQFRFGPESSIRPFFEWTEEMQNAWTEAEKQVRNGKPNSIEAKQLIDIPTSDYVN